MSSTTFDFGTKTVTLTLTAGSVWEKGDIKRVYHDIDVDGKANPLSKFYEVISGATKDKTISVNGRTFGYVYGFADSKSKRAAVDTAVADLAAQI